MVKISKQHVRRVYVCDLACNDAAHKRHLSQPLRTRAVHGCQCRATRAAKLTLDRPV